MKTITLLLLLAAASFGETPEPLAKAYEALKAKDYDRAIPVFVKALADNPQRADVRKDLAYTYLKVGESEAARDKFGEAMRLDPADTHVALEYAFLCYESRGDPIVWKATARRIFDQLRKKGNADAERAFQNIDRPLEEGIERWSRALKLGTDNSSVHYELAQLAEQRDQLDLAAEHYLRAWQLQPTAKTALVDLGRVLWQAGRVEDARAAWLAASRGGETRAAESAREALPERYPYVYEFRKALALDGANVNLHRELAYLLLRMSEDLEGDAQRSRQLEAEDEFRSSWLPLPTICFRARNWAFCTWAERMLITRCRCSSGFSTAMTGILPTRSERPCTLTRCSRNARDPAKTRWSTCG